MSSLPSLHVQDMKKDRHIGVMNARYINIFARLCKFACVTPRDIVDTFNELRSSLSKGELKASAPSSSPSRRPKGRRGNIALQDGSGYRENYDRPCTGEPGEKQCWLMSELEPWNRLLSRTYVELQEHSWGELTMRGYSSPKSCIPQASDALRSSLLMHVLLQQHRCLTRVVLNQNVTLIEMNIFWHGLQNGGAGVQYFKYIGPLSDQCPVRHLFDMQMWCHSVACLSALHSLDIRHVFFDDDVAHMLGRYLARSTTLKCIALHDVQAGVGEAIAFLGYLAENKTVTSLTLPEHLVVPHDSEVLADVVRNHVALENLEIRGTTESTPSAVLRAALQSSSLKSLTVNFFTILAEDIEAMAAALTQRPPSCTAGTDATAGLTPASTSHLESLTFYYCTPCDPRLQRAYAALIGGGLVELKIRGFAVSEEFAINAASQLRMDSRLRVLDIKNNKLSAASVCVLVQALGVNYTLEQMACNLYCSTPDLDLLTMFNAIRELGASSRIDVDWYEPLPSYVAQFGGLCRISTLLLDLANCSAEDARNLLEPLVSATNITKVGIECDEPAGHAVVEQLVDALCKTKAIRDLNLLLNWPENHIVSVLRSLEQNRSISELDIGGMTFNRRSAKALARLVEQNRTLNKIFVNVDEEDSGGCPQIRTVCRELKEAIPRNRFLTTVAVNSLSGNCASDIVIKEALRRNRMLVNQAVHFVKGSDSKKDALAFETLQHSRTLVRQLCKDSGDPDEASARGKIDKARRRLTLDYFIFTGVVKDKVACHPRSKRKPGFDKLDKHVQAHICSYLSLTDVMDV
ncbi:uncharacterized protein LOC144108299 [Amblyomma americanum]